MVAMETAMSRQRRRRGQWATATKATTAMVDECVCCMCLCVTKCVESRQVMCHVRRFELGINSYVYLE
jgi:hypothetical protein